MAKHSGPRSSSAATERDAMQIARSIQRPGQSKEQTRLIARGIEQGIAQYKQKEKARAREREKQRKRSAREAAAHGGDAKQRAEQPAAVEIRYRQHWLPWALLALTWLAGGAYLVIAQ